MPRTSSGVVSRRTRMQGSPWAALAVAAAEENTMRPTAPPGLAAMPRIAASRGPRGSTCLCSSSDSARGGMRSTASSLRDDPVLGQGHGDLQRRPRRAADAHGVKHEETVVFDGEFDLHLFAQPHPRQSAEADQFGKGFGAEILQRRAALIAGQVDRAFAAGQRVATLRLAAIAAGDLRQAGGGVDKLDHPGAGFRPAQPQRHPLHHQPQPGIGRRARAPCAAAAPRCPDQARAIERSTSAS